MDTPNVQFLYCVSHCVNESNKLVYTWLAEKQSSKLYKLNKKQALDSAAKFDKVFYFYRGAKILTPISAWD